MHADARLLELRDRLSGQILRGTGGVQYFLRDLIGEGGQGWVFRANWDEPDGFGVIVKVLRPDAVSADALARFQREADVLRMLSQQARPNPYIVRFFDHAIAQMPSPIGGEPLVLPFTVLEYVNGPSLEKVLEETTGRGIPLDRARRVLKQVMQALEAVHAQKVVHRDLKPSNILIAKESGTEIAKVTDFGLVKLVDPNMRATVTLAGASVGYAPPEQYEKGNQRVTARTDVFSFAAIAFELLTGRMAFPFRDGDNPLIVISRILGGERPSLRHIGNNKLSPELENRSAVIDAIDAELVRALDASPDKRHPTIAEIWKALEPLFRAAIENQPLPNEKPGQPALAFIETLPAYSKGAPDLASTRPSAHDNSSLMERRSPLADASNARLDPSAVRRPISSNPGISPQAEVSNPRIERVPSAPPGPSPSPAVFDSVVRVRKTDAEAATPASWTWRILTAPLSPGVARAAAFSADGQSAVGVGPGGVARWEHQTWYGIPLPTGMNPAMAHGIRKLRSGDIVIFGDAALLVRIAPSGVHEVIGGPDRQASFHGAHVDEITSTIVFVGERPLTGRGVRPGATVGTTLTVKDGRPGPHVDIAGSTRLNAVARVLSGAVVACGDWGALGRIDGGEGRFLGSICGGHLMAITAMPDGGAVTVGAGGYALYLSSRLEAKLEAVQTTKDLGCVGIGADGTPWAGAAQARVLRRTEGSWIRMTGELGLVSNVLAIWASNRTVRAICDDGAVFEGNLP
jgi:serine/threonine-protein kinase